MAAVTEQQIQAALGKRKKEIAGNLETLTLKKLRKELAEDLSVDESAIKEHKDFLTKAVDEIVAWAHKRSAKRNNDTANENKSPPNKPAKESAKEASNPAPRKKAPSKKAAKPATTKSVNGTVQRLKDMCKDATITIPPALYKRASDTEELVQELEALLDKHGLTRSSGPREVTAVKAKLTKEKELEGIDLGNIIEDSGRGRRRAAAAAVDYKKMVQASTSDEEEEVDEEDDDDEEDSEVEDGSDAEMQGEGDDEEDAEAEEHGAGDDEEDPKGDEEEEAGADLEDNELADDDQQPAKGKRVMLSDDDSL